MHYYSMHLYISTHFHTFHPLLHRCPIALLCTIDLSTWVSCLLARLPYIWLYICGYPMISECLDCLVCSSHCAPLWVAGCHLLVYSLLLRYWSVQVPSAGFCLSVSLALCPRLSYIFRLKILPLKASDICIPSCFALTSFIWFSEEQPKPCSHLQPKFMKLLQVMAKHLACVCMCVSCSSHYPKQTRITSNHPLRFGQQMNVLCTS